MDDWSSKSYLIQRRITVGYFQLLNKNLPNLISGLSWWLNRKEFTCYAEDAGDAGSIPELKNPLEDGMETHSSILAILMDREAWWATVHGVAKRWKQLKTEVTEHSCKLNSLTSFPVANIIVSPTCKDCASY